MIPENGGIESPSKAFGIKRRRFDLRPDQAMCVPVVGSPPGLGYRHLYQALVRSGGWGSRANYALFLTELCDIIGVPRPEPASANTERNDYVFERFVRRRDGSTGRIDLYRRDAVVLEAKQSRQVVGGDEFVQGDQPGLP